MARSSSRRRAAGTLPLRGRSLRALAWGVAVGGALLPLARKRLRLPPVASAACASAAPFAMAVAVPRSRRRDVAVYVRAWIAGVDAIRRVDPGARVVSVEPLIHTVPPRGGRDVGERAAAQNESQWEAWDMVVGRSQPELGGHPRYLDILGVNFYHDNQWEVPGGRKIHWHVKPRDPRWVPFSTLLRRAYDRYQRPIIIGETSHVGSGRAEWIRELTDEVLLAIKAGLPLEGICLYPIMDRFEWNDPTHWHNSGLWDYDIEPDGTFRRVLNVEYAEEFLRSQLRLAAVGFGSVEPDEATA